MAGKIIFAGKEILNGYLKKYARFNGFINASPHPDLSMVVVIPAYNEPDVTGVLDSLAKCYHSENLQVEVIMIINEEENPAEDVAVQNSASLEQANKWNDDNPAKGFSFFPVYLKGLKKKIAGVGTARKAGMDEAVRRFLKAGREDGLIVNLDADCTVSENYFSAIRDHFDKYNPEGASIYFEHPDSGSDSPSGVAIAHYESYLRLHKNGLQQAGSPYAFHTIGSAMAVTMKAYQEVGGMNKRKGGEDFYFLQKIIFRGKFSKILNTTVFPSARPSDRVPFGTGRAIRDVLTSGKEIRSYNPSSYEMLRKFLGEIDRMYKEQPELPDEIKNFLDNLEFGYHLDEMRQHSSSLKVFRKRFHHWFNGFTTLKFFHYLREHHFPDVPLLEGCMWLTRENGDIMRQLDILRAMDRAELHFPVPEDGIKKP